MCSMTTHSFTLTRYDPEHPWIVLSTDRLTVDLPDDQAFTTWAADRFGGKVYVARQPPFLAAEKRASRP